jgi:membrane associated rhomboid family serine protease
MPRFTFFDSVVVPARLVFLMWLSFFLELNFGWPISTYGIEPRTVHGLAGIFIAPLAHGDLIHLASNTFPLLFLGSALFMFYGHVAHSVFYRTYFWTNSLVWLLARPANHIGASGVVYGLAFFLIFYGLFRREIFSMLLSILTLILYGSVFYGLLPGDPRVSWESHVAGALVGIGSAITFSRKNRMR